MRTVKGRKYFYRRLFSCWGETNMGIGESTTPFLTPRHRRSLWVARCHGKDTHGKKCKSSYKNYFSYFIHTNSNKRLDDICRIISQNRKNEHAPHVQRPPCFYVEASQGNLREISPTPKVGRVKMRKPHHNAALSQKRQLHPNLRP